MSGPSKLWEGWGGNDETHRDCRAAYDTLARGLAVARGELDAQRVLRESAERDVIRLHSDLQAKCAELAESDRQLHAALKREVAALPAVVAERNALRAEVERLRGALEKYAHHLSSCRTTDWTLGVKAWDDASCDCGLRAALAAEQPSDGARQPDRREGGG